MTAPIVIQQEGLGQTVQRGLAPLLQAIQFNRRQAQAQQFAQLQQQQLQLQALSQRQAQRNQVTGRMLQLMQLLGPEILEDPTVAQSLDAAGLKASSLLKTFRDQRAIAAKQREQQVATVRETLTQSVPDELRPGLTVAFNALNAGMSQDNAGWLMRAVFEHQATQIDPERRAELAAEFPMLFGERSGLSTSEGMEQLARIRGLQAEVKAGVGPEARRQVLNALSEIRRGILQQQRDLQSSDLNRRLRAALAINRAVGSQIQDFNVIGTHPRADELLQADLVERARILFDSTVSRAYERSLTIVSEFLTTEPQAPPSPEPTPDELTPGAPVIPGLLPPP